jgi:DNA-binding IclR family transcriptional regulator
MVKGKADGDGGNGQRAVQSIEVGGRLLLVLGAHAGPMSLKDLAAEAGLPPARAHPYLVSFGKLRLIEQDPASGRYALGPAALQVGLTALYQLDPIRSASPVAEQLAASTGYAVALALWGNFGPTIVRMIEARQPLLIAMRAGTVMSVLGTATGRAFAASMPTQRVASALAGALGDPPLKTRRLGKEDTEVIELARRDLKRYGLVRAEGRPIPGINAFSAAALNHDGEPALVITALGREDDFSTDWDSQAADAVRHSAAEISTRLGWKRPVAKSTA